MSFNLNVQLRVDRIIRGIKAMELPMNHIFGYCIRLVGRYKASLVLSLILLLVAMAQNILVAILQCRIAVTQTRPSLP